MPNDPQPLPEPTDKEKKEADQSVKDWLKKEGYPSPDPKDQ